LFVETMHFCLLFAVSYFAHNAMWHMKCAQYSPTDVIC
jgi:hypothetical protein